LSVTVIAEVALAPEESTAEIVTVVLAATQLLPDVPGETVMVVPLTEA
jgi:hypothetical protein